MPIKLTHDQSTALDAIKGFLRDSSLDTFILRGSAGTGKTTLIASLVKTLEDMNLSCALLAPTGRAARILGNKVGQITGRDIQGSTIHAAIYTLAQVDVNEEAETTNDPGIRMVFPLKDEEPTVSLFVIDESSMVGDREVHGDFLQFGSGRLLKDIVTFARLQRPGRDGDHLTKLLFVGDPAQLPPVGENTSPALSDDYLKTEYKLKVASIDLTTVMRQAQGSAILDRAIELRDALSEEQFNGFSLKPDDQEIIQVDAQRAIDLIAQGIQGRQSNVTVVHSNATALEYNRSVRERLWGDANLPVQVRDILLVNKNSPHHSLSNGDLVKVVQVDAEPEKVQVALKGGSIVDLSFRLAEVAFRAGDSTIVKQRCFFLENQLDSAIREMSPWEQRALLVHFRNRHPNLHPKSAEFRRTIVNDPYFNALQVKYGYAMTCHKAQGGEWDTVLIDFSYSGGVRNASFFRWAYTAITRAAKKLIVINAPEFDVIDDGMWRTLAAPQYEKMDQSGPDPTTDPDWLRLSFSTAIAQLMPTHQKLRTFWSSQGISIDQLQHLQYCERYTLVRDETQAMVQYYYDGKYRVGRTGIVPNAFVDQQLVEDALAAFSKLKGGRAEEKPDRFIQDFLDRLDVALDGAAIQRIDFRPMPYRLRVSFSDADRKGDIDFTYNGTLTWTAAQEVGGLGASHGLYDDIQELMSRLRS